MAPAMKISNPTPAYPKIFFTLKVPKNVLCLFFFTERVLQCFLSCFLKLFIDSWCSTKVDDAGNHVSGQGKYGFCHPECNPYSVLEDLPNLVLQNFNKPKPEGNFK